jgi:GNAT superfamily N-acetyltransferase
VSPHLVIETYDPSRHGRQPFDLVQRVFRDYGWEMDEGGEYGRDVLHPHEYYPSRGGAFGVAMQAARVVGCVGLVELSPELFELRRLYVDAASRRAGAGAKLVEWMEQQAQQRGGCEAVLYSDTVFQEAHRLYERCGWRCAGFRYSDDPWKGPQRVFRKALAESYPERPPVEAGVAKDSAFREPFPEERVVPYSQEKHGDGPWRVVATVFEEYGFEFAVSDYDADLARPEEFYAGERNAFFVVEDNDGVVGCVGYTDEGGGVFELHRLYALPRARRTGMGEALVRKVIGEARRLGGKKVILFSDVMFEDAHRLYTRCGFRCTRFRYAPDPWQSREWGFELHL